MTTEDSDLEECFDDVNISGRELAEKSSRANPLAKTLQRRGVLNDGERHWFGETSYYVYEPPASYNPQSRSHVAYGTIPYDDNDQFN